MKGFDAGYLLLDEVLLSMLWSDGSFQFAINHSMNIFTIGKVAW